MTFVLTDRHREVAAQQGRARAFAEYTLDVSAPSENPLDDEDIRQLAWEITTVKLEPDSEDADILATAYLDAYYDEWEYNIGT